MKKLQADLGDEVAKRLKVLVSGVPIRRSRVLHERDSGPGRSAIFRFQYDLSRVPGPTPGPKPFVVIESMHVAPDLIEETRDIIRNAMTWEEFRRLRESPQPTRARIAGFARRVPLANKVVLGSQDKPTRSANTTGMCLAIIAAAGTPKRALLVTNRCSTNCKMCSLYRRGKEAVLSLSEISYSLMRFEAWERDP